MIQILAFLLGFFSILTLCLCILKHKQYDNLKKFRLQKMGWCMCAFSLYIPTLSQYMAFCANDYDSMIDCIATYHLMSMFLLIIVSCLSIIIKYTNCRNK